MSDNKKKVSSLVESTSVDSSTDWFVMVDTSAGVSGTKKVAPRKVLSGVNVMAYGATGDGTTDDSAAINAAIQANAGKTIFFPWPSVDYYIGTKINNDQECRLLGENALTILEWNGASDASDYAVYSNGIVENLRINVIGTRRALHVQGVSDLDYQYAMRNVRLHNADTVALFCDNVAGATIDNITISNLQSGIGIDALGVNRTTFNRISGNGGTPDEDGGVIQFRNTSNALVNGLNIETTNATGSMVNLNASFGIQIRNIVTEDVTCNNNPIIRLEGAPQHDQATVDVDGVSLDTNTGCTELIFDITSTRSFSRVRNFYATTSALTSIVKIDGTNRASHRQPEFEACYSDQLNPGDHISLVNGATTNVVSASRLNNFATRCYTDNVTTPTDAELDAAFGTPAEVGAGAIRILDDAGAGTTMLICVSDGTNWWFQSMTKAT